MDRRYRLSQWRTCLVFVVFLAGDCSSTSLKIDVQRLRGFDGGAVEVQVKPLDTCVTVNLCSENRGCELSDKFSGSLIFTNLTSYTYYNVTATDVYNSNTTVFMEFVTDTGTPKTGVSFTKIEAGIFSFDLAWEPINRTELRGPPTGYRLVACNTTCVTLNTTGNSASIRNLRPRVTYTLRLWTYNVNSFGEILEDETLFSTAELVTLADSLSALIVVLLLSAGLIIVLTPFIIYLRRSRINKRQNELVTMRMRNGVPEEDRLLSRHVEWQR